ncbi:MAG: SpoIIE family protein phosphatase [Bacteroidetes bacterium]|nr:SpoIIE family protein phosphatase [Bacteroidota bacterium]
MRTLLDIRENPMIPMGTQYFDIVQDRRGIIYFANGGGIFEFDGINLKYIPANDAFVFSLAIDSSGIVYVGAKYEFGYLSPGTEGNMHFVSLVNELPDNARNFGSVKKIIANSEGVYFLSKQFLFRWFNHKIHIVKPETYFYPENFFIFGKHFVIQDKTGLMEVAGNSITPAPAGEFFKSKYITAMLKYDNNKILTVTQKTGIYLYDYYSGRIDTFITSCRSEIGTGTALNNETFAFASSNVGLKIIDIKGNIVNSFNKSSGIQDNIINKIFVDQENGLWLASDNDVSRLEYPSPVTWFGEANGLPGSIFAVVSLNETIYAATANGLYFLKTGDNHNNSDARFLHYKSIRGHTILGLLPCRYHILVATDFGVYVFEDENSIRIGNPDIAYCLAFSADSSVIFSGHDSYLGCMRINQNTGSFDIQVFNKVKIEGQARTIAEDKNGDIWIGTDIERIYRLDFNGNFEMQPEIEIFDSAMGLPSISYVSVIGGKPLFGTWTGLYTFDSAKNMIIPDTMLGKIFCDGSNDVFKIGGIKNKNFYMVAGEKIHFAHLNEKSVYNVTSKPFLRIPETAINDIFLDGNGIAWFGSDLGIFRYNPSVEKLYTAPFYSLIRRVAIDKDSVIFSGSFYSKIITGNDTEYVASLLQPDEIIISLPYRYNNINFEFAATSYDNESHIQYSYFLDGFDREWSDWNYESKKSYTNLPHGRYHFRVKALNVYQQESTEGIYEFSILPPWYMTLWAYSGYILLFFGLLYSGIRINTVRLQREKKILEAIVAERTAVVVKQKQVIEEKNKDITDSIEYARYLQEAVLPDAGQLKKILPESFIYYQPKDILSGDFYWFSKQDGKKMVAACDCTGHGVPGALLSVLCNNLLFQAVFDHGKKIPGDILSEVNKNVLDALKKEGAAVQAEEGMDVSLCVIDSEKGIVSFAGANHTLVILNEGNINEIRGNFTPVGGNTPAGFNFTTHTIPLNNGSNFYLTTDGYYSQFGGPKGKKLTRRGFYEIIRQAARMSIESQATFIRQKFFEWKGSYGQVDDVLVMGFRV